MFTLIICHTFWLGVCNQYMKYDHPTEDQCYRAAKLYIETSAKKPESIVCVPRKLRESKMKLKFWCDANSGTGKGEASEIMDTERDFGISGEEWLSMSELDQDNYVLQWAEQRISYGWEEVK